MQDLALDEGGGLGSTSDASTLTPWQLPQQQAQAKKQKK